MFIKKQKEYFGINIFNFILLNMKILTFSILTGLCFGLCPIIESNFFKHIFFGTFSYSFIALFLIVIFHKFKKNIIKRTIIVSVVFSIPMVFWFEMDSMNIQTLLDQICEIVIDIVGSFIIFSINYYLYNKSLERNI